MLIDGVYCPMCKEFHPSLLWHTKYKEYMAEDKYLEQYQKAMNRFHAKVTLAEAKEKYLKRLGLIGLYCANAEGPCRICGEITCFCNQITKHYVCCKQCKDRDREVN